MNKLTAIVLIGLISIALSAPIDKEEIGQLSKLKPCRGQQAGSRVKHPGNEHKFLRCVSRDSFWIETCPDNLFYNAELDLCDWSVITRTTTEGPDVVVKFRPILFRHNKTVKTHHRPRRPLDLSRVSVKITPDTQMFPGQEDIVDTLTPIHTNINRLESKGFSTHKAKNFGNGGSSFTHFNKDEDKEIVEVDPSEFTALPSKKMTHKEKENHMETTTEKPMMRVRTTTERPIVRTTTERPVVRTTTERPIIRIRTTTERPVIVEEPVEVVERPMEKFVDEDEDFHMEHDDHVEEHDEEHDDEGHDHDYDEEIIEENEDKPVLIRHGNIVKVTEPKEFIETRRRPLHKEDVDAIVRRPFKTKEIIEEFPVHEEHEEHRDHHPVEEVEVVPVETHHHRRRPVEKVEVVPVETRHRHRHPVDKVEVVPVETHHHHHHRRPVEEIDVIPEEEEFEFTTARTPVFTTTRRTFNRIHTVPSRTQLFKKLAEEIPGARVVSFNGRPVESKF